MDDQAVSSTPPTMTATSFTATSATQLAVTINWSAGTSGIATGQTITFTIGGKTYSNTLSASGSSYTITDSGFTAGTTYNITKATIGAYTFSLSGSAIMPTS